MGWTTQKNARLLTLFRTGQAPVRPDNGDSISHKLIERVWDANPIFQTVYTKRAFYPLYRRKAAEFLTNQPRVALGVRTITPRVQFAVFPPSFFILFCSRSHDHVVATVEKKAPPAAFTEEEEDAADGDYDFFETAKEEEAEKDLKPASKPAAKGTEDVEDDVSSNFGKMSRISATATLHLPVLVYEYF